METFPVLLKQTCNADDEERREDRRVVRKRKPNPFWMKQETTHLESITGLSCNGVENVFSEYISACTLSIARSISDISSEGKEKDKWGQQWKYALIAIGEPSWLTCCIVHTGIRTIASIVSDRSTITRACVDSITLGEQARWWKLDWYPSNKLNAGEFWCTHRSTSDCTSIP